MSYRYFFTRERVRSFSIGVILFILAVIFQYYASAYSSRVSSNFVHDLFLDNLPVINLNWLIVEGALAAIAGTVVLLLTKPRYIIFTLKAAALFIATRAIFVSVTHVGIYPGQIMPGAGFFDELYTRLGLAAGFFFSGHTGLTFLMALVFWRERLWRAAYLLLSFSFAVAVLFAHVHYSIDVLAAPFITYTVFSISRFFFAEDYQLITDGVR